MGGRARRIKLILCSMAKIRIAGVFLEHENRHWGDGRPDRHVTNVFYWNPFLKHQLGHNGFTCSPLTRTHAGPGSLYLIDISETFLNSGKNLLGRDSFASADDSIILHDGEQAGTW